MPRFGDKLLPLILAVVAGVILAVGIGGFRAERPGIAFWKPLTTRPLITEVEPEVRAITLPGGATMDLDPGTVAYALALYLQSDDAAPQSFDLRGVSFPLADDDAESARTLDALATILEAWPTAHILFRGDAGEGEKLMQILERNGIAAGRMAIDSGHEEKDGLLSSLKRLTLIEPRQEQGMQLVVTAR